MDAPSPSSARAAATNATRWVCPAWAWKSQGVASSARLAALRWQHSASATSSPCNTDTPIGPSAIHTTGLRDNGGGSEGGDRLQIQPDRLGAMRKSHASTAVRLVQFRAGRSRPRGRATARPRHSREAGRSSNTGNAVRGGPAATSSRSQDASVAARRQPAIRAAGLSRPWRGRAARGSPQAPSRGDQGL
jgi:hypothetical protein